MTVCLSRPKITQRPAGDNAHQNPFSRREHNLSDIPSVGIGEKGKNVRKRRAFVEIVSIFFAALFLFGFLAILASGR